METKKYQPSNGYWESFFLGMIIVLVIGPQYWAISFIFIIIPIIINLINKTKKIKAYLLCSLTFSLGILFIFLVKLIMSYFIK